MLDAVIFDLDGVLVDTTPLHAGAWKRAFDEVPGAGGFDPDADYRAHVDGKPRYQGAAAWLEERGVGIPFGDPSDPPGTGTVCAVGNLKDRAFHEALDRRGIDLLPGTRGLLDDLAGRRVGWAVVSSSRNAKTVLEAAGLEPEVVVDGTDLGALAGKPDPATFLEAARRLGRPPWRAAVVEDAVVGVEAGRRGGFANVVGIGDRDALEAAGADSVSSAIAEVDPDRLLNGAPHDADGAFEGISRVLGPAPAVFCDYDGTLTPIVDDPDDAVLAAPTRDVLRRLSERCPVAIVSGRALADVRAKVGLDGVVYAGSHGFEIDGPGGLHLEHEEAAGALPELDRIEGALRSATAPLDGVHVERKPFAVALHTRRARSQADREAAVEAASRLESGLLERSSGKEIVEFRPALDWDKGRAVEFVLEALGGDHRPLYLGDDTTDEDAFRALGGTGGIGIRVGGGETSAPYRLDDPAAVRRFLERLLGLPD